MTQFGNGNGRYIGPERRNGERREGADRRDVVRWEPQKADRRKLGVGADRRRAGLWNNLGR